MRTVDLIPIAVPDSVHGESIRSRGVSGSRLRGNGNDERSEGRKESLKVDVQGSMCKVCDHGKNGLVGGRGEGVCGERVGRWWWVVGEGMDG